MHTNSTHPEYIMHKSTLWGEKSLKDGKYKKVILSSYPSAKTEISFLKPKHFHDTLSITICVT